MNINIKDRITLNDNIEYSVVSKTNYLEKTYYFLMDVNNNTNIKFCYEKPEANSVIEVEDENLNQALLPLFYNATKDIVGDLKLEEQV